MYIYIYIYIYIVEGALLWETLLYILSCNNDMTLILGNLDFIRQELGKTVQLIITCISCS